MPRAKSCTTSDEIASRGCHSGRTIKNLVRRSAPCVFDGPMDGASFLTYVEHFLAPTLHQGDVVVLDNLASHKVAGVKEAIERAGATLRYLPAYSADYTLTILNTAAIDFAR